VAVKIFRPEPSNDSAAALERFRFEGMAGSRTRHPNIVEVLDAGISDDGIPFIAMELLDGHSLDVELEKAARVPMARACTLLSQACRGLAAAHAAGVIHRDIKPENIFIHRDGDRETVKVLDFGIAKVKDTAFAGMNALTGTGALIGTPLYMAPERFLGQECTEKADSYSVGIILYRALSGELPFQGTVAQIMMQALSAEPPTLRRVAPEVPAALAAVIRAAMQDDPATRPTVDAIADVLDEVSPPVSASAA
jgi:serine/threonine protein kinase